MHFWKVLGSILATTNCFHENILIWLVQVQYTRKIVLVLLPEAIREAWSDKVTTGTTLAMKGMFKVLKSQVQIHFTVTVLYKKTIVFCTSKVSREIFDIVFFFLSRDARIRWIVFGWKLFFRFKKKLQKIDALTEICWKKRFGPTLGRDSNSELPEKRSHLHWADSNSWPLLTGQMVQLDECH